MSRLTSHQPAHGPLQHSPRGGDAFGLFNLVRHLRGPP